MHCGRFGRTKTNFANKLETKRYEKTITGNNIGCMRHYDARHPIDEGPINALADYISAQK